MQSSFIFLATCSLSSAKLADWIAALAPPSFTSPSVTDDVVEINSVVAAGGGGAVRDRVLCEHGAERGTPWAQIRLAGEGEFGAQDLYVFAAVVDPDARSLLMVAFIKDERPRFLWDHMQTSYDSNAILAGARCEWGSSGVSTAARSTVEISVDGAETLLRPWDGGAVDTWFAKRPTWAPDEVPRFSNVVRVVCDLPADTDENSVSLDPSAEWSVTLRRSGGGAEERRHEIRSARMFLWWMRAELRGRRDALASSAEGSYPAESLEPWTTWLERTLQADRDLDLQIPPEQVLTACLVQLMS